MNVVGHDRNVCWMRKLRANIKWTDITPEVIVDALMPLKAPAPREMSCRTILDTLYTLH